MTLKSCPIPNCQGEGEITSLASYCTLICCSQVDCVMHDNALTADAWNALPRDTSAKKLPRGLLKKQQLIEELKQVVDPTTCKHDPRWVKSDDPQKFGDVCRQMFTCQLCGSRTHIRRSESGEVTTESWVHPYKTNICEFEYGNISKRGIKCH